MSITTHNIAAVGLFSALAVCSGYALISIPNVEGITTIVFLSGFILGKTRGMLIGAISETIYGSFNPYGMAVPLLLAGMVLSMSIAGFCGGIFRNHLSDHPIRMRIQLGLAGFFLTILFAILTTLAYILASGMDLKQARISLYSGIAFYLLHASTNTLLFSLLIPSLNRICSLIPLFSMKGRTA